MHYRIEVRGSARNPKLNENLIGFILGVLLKDRKETLASLVKILNNNFGVKVSEKAINRVLHARDIEWKNQYWYINLMKGSRKVESNFVNITFVLLIMQDMCILINLIFIQRIHINKMGISRWGDSWRTKKNLK